MIYDRFQEVQLPRTRENFDIRSVDVSACSSASFRNSQKPTQKTSVKGEGLEGIGGNAPINHLRERGAIFDIRAIFLNLLRANPCPESVAVPRDPRGTLFVRLWDVNEVLIGGDF